MTLKDRLDEDPQSVEGWRPEIGQELIGTIVRMDERQTDDYPDPYPILTIKPIEGDLIAFHAFHTVAKTELAGQEPQVGDEIGIRYLGEEKGARYSYHNYRIVVEKNKHSIADQESIGVTQAAVEAEKDEIPF